MIGRSADEMRMNSSISAKAAHTAKDRSQPQTLYCSGATLRLLHSYLVELKVGNYNLSDHKKTGENNWWVLVQSNWEFGWGGVSVSLRCSFWLRILLLYQVIVPHGWRMFYFKRLCPIYRKVFSDLVTKGTWGSDSFYRRTTNIYSHYIYTYKDIYMYIYIYTSLSHVSYYRTLNIVPALYSKSLLFYVW